MFCDKCGKALPDNADFCDGCGEKISMSPNHVDETDMFNVGSASLEDVPAKSKKKSSIIVSAIAVIVFVVLIVAILVKIFGDNGAATKLVHGVQETVMSGGAEYSVKIEDEEGERSFEGFFTVNAKEQTAEFSYEVEQGTVVYRVEEDEIFYYVNDKEYDESQAIKFDLEDFEDNVDFTLDSELIFKLVKELGKKDIEKLDYEEWLEEFDLTDYIEDYGEPKDVDNALEAVLDTLDKNAEECLGYEKVGDTHIYDIDVYETLIVAVEAIEKYVVEEDDYEELLDYIDDNKKYIKDIDNVELEVTYDGKYITDATVKFGDLEIEITLENIGECDQSYKDDIEDVLNEDEE